jgi:hypothetical protein
MAAWLEKPLWWVSILIAVCWIGYNFDLAQYYPPIVYGVAILIVLVGLVARLTLGRG